MPKRVKKQQDTPAQTTAQQLGSLIKSARDIMRKDKGLSGELDRLPMLVWILFLKFLDDSERLFEQEAKLAGKRYHPTVEPPYRWRDWAAGKDSLTGDALISFINQEEAVRPDGTKGKGLFAYLRGLEGNGKTRKDVIANVFRGTVNRMISGYLLRDLIDKVGGIHFDSTEEMQTLGHLYESMLREMRDAAKDSGEFYTPRSVVQFMVRVMDPKIGESVLDPACGTGGFLAESYSYMNKSCKTVQQRETLQSRSIYGQEAKPLPYLLAEMNLLLHGLEFPDIKYGNTLSQKLTEIGDAQRVDVILTNPPFGGEEEKAVESNFPAGMQTSETALLFLQYIMRKLRRPSAKSDGGRAAVVVPNGTLFGDGVCERIKQDLLKDFDLHTIVRLPGGVFAPYTSIPTNILFFNQGGPTKTVWFYEIPLPEGRKNYTKTQPMPLSDFEPCIAWWTKRKATPQAWKVTAKELLADHCNLDRKNPNAKDDPSHLPLEKLIESILAKELKIVELVKEIKKSI